MYHLFHQTPIRVSACPAAGDGSFRETAADIPAGPCRPDSGPAFFPELPAAVSCTGAGCRTEFPAAHQSNSVPSIRSGVFHGLNYMLSNC